MPESSEVFTVHGRVIVAETGDPIPNVLVSVFDADPGKAAISGLLVGGVDTGDQWSSFGDAIGTAISDASGVFELRYDRRSFDDTGGDLRPDLKLAAFAPATADIQQLIAPSRRERLLLVLDAPRFNAGVSEGFVLRLTEQLAIDRGLITRPVQVLVPEPEEFLDLERAALLASAKRRMQRKEVVAEVRAADSTRRLAARATGATKARQLSVLAADERAHPLVLPASGTRAERGLRIKWTKHNDFRCGGDVAGRVGVGSGW